MLYSVSQHSYFSSILFNHKRGQTLLQKMIMKGLKKWPSCYSTCCYGRGLECNSQHHMVSHTTCNSRPRSSNTVFWPSWTPTQICACMYTHRHTHTQIKKLYKKRRYKNTIEGAGEMVPRLRVLAVLPEAPGSVPTTHMAFLTSSRIPSTLTLTYVEARYQCTKSTFFKKCSRGRLW